VDPTTAPHVIIIGGYLTEPLQYRPLRRRLLDRGAARVSIAPVHLPDHAVMPFVGMGPLLLRGGRAIREARRLAPAPLIVVGHSMGGLVARLAMAPEPLDGRLAGVAEDVGCLVTLGTPHRLQPQVPWRHPGIRAIEHLERCAPGAAFAPRTGYLTVGSTLGRPARRRPIRTPIQLANRILRGFVGDPPDALGDGLVPDALSRLDGARHVTYPEARHGAVGGPWYGDSLLVDRWWPLALAAWRAALDARGEADLAA
jgi:pimeloyl-ACP methyl ester carboxylesterase